MEVRVVEVTVLVGEEEGTDWTLLAIAAARPEGIMT